MGLFSTLSTELRAMIDDATTPQSFKMGEQFENYVREFLFIDSYYDILERTHSYKTNRDSLKPEFTFRDKWTKK